MIDRGIRELFPDDGYADALEPVLAAVRALEPGRARRALAAATGVDPATRAALERLVDVVDHCSWPGAALRPGAWPPPSAESVLPFEAYWWGEVLPRSLLLRSTAGYLTGEGDSTGEPSEFDRWEGAARAAADPTAAAHARLIEADTRRRRFNVPYARLLAGRVLADAGGQPGVAGAALLLIGDLAVTPETSPETLGSTLERPLDDTRIDLAGLEEADRCYRRARAVLGEAGRDRGVATADLRRAFVARLRGDVDEAATLLDDAAAGARGADDGATAVLALVHRALLRLENPAVARRPDPVPRIEEWVADGGSTGWVLGCARVALAAAERAERRGAAEEALATYGLAERLLDASGLTDVEVLQGRTRMLLLVGSHGLAAATWEETYAAEHGASELPADRWERLATALVLVVEPMLQARDADGLRTVVARAQQLVDRRPPTPSGPPADRRERVARWGPGGSDRSDALATRLTEVIATLPAVATFHGAAISAAEGLGSSAERALESLTRSEGHEDLAVRALALLGRVAEARDRAVAWLATGPGVSGHLEAELWHLVGEHDRAWAVLGEDAAARDEVVWEQDWFHDQLRARIALGRGRPDEARVIAEQALERVGRWFAGLTSDTFRISALDDEATVGLLDALVLACVQQDDRPATFAAADHLRSLALGALLDEPGTRELRRWRQARAEWNGAVDERREVWRRPEPAELARTAAALAEADRRVEEAGQRLGVRPVPRAPQEPVDAAEVCAALGDSLLLQYTLAGDHLVIVALTAAGVQVRVREVRATTLAGLCHLVHRGWSGAGAIRTYPDDLAALFLEPVADVLEDHARVLVVPCGPAMTIPFAGLPFAGSCLLEHRTISQLPAASLVPRLAGAPGPTFDADCLVVGNPPSTDFPRLPGAEAEAVLVGRSLGGRTLLGAAATEPRVRRELTTRTPVAHLACHGDLHEHAPDLSAVMLAGDDRVTVAELLGVGLDVDVAVLSACSTGRGEVTRSGAVVGLARGLLAAGVRHAVTSLWDVEDAPTCLTMTAFAEHLAAGVGVADALARAQRGVRALTRDEAREQYLDLGVRAGVDLTAAGATRRRGDGPAMPGGRAMRPNQWAPFVHLGV